MSSPIEQLQAVIGQTFDQTPSPFMRWLNPVVIRAEIGELVFEYTVRNDMSNPVGTLHGGVTAAIMDDIIGATMFSFGEPFFYTTISNVIDYFFPAFPADRILAQTLVLKKGKQIVNVQCEIWNSDRTRLLARGTSNLVKTEIRKGG